MKRKILFRGYNLKNKKWLYGYYLFNRGKHFIAEEGLQPPGMTWEDFEVDPESVGQYVCSVRDVDVYEGDIVKKYYVEGQLNGVIVGVVHFYEEVLMWYIVDLKTREPLAHLNWLSSLSKYEVIGNEYNKKLKISNP